MKRQPLTLNTICGGMVEQVFNRELARVCENIADPSTKTEAVRKVSVVVTIKPNARGTMAEVGYDVKSSMPGVETEKSAVYIAQDPDSKNITLFPVDLRQEELPLPSVEEIRPIGQSHAVHSHKPVAFTPPQPNEN